EAWEGRHGNAGLPVDEPLDYLDGQVDVLGIAVVCLLHLVDEVVDLFVDPPGLVAHKLLTQRLPVFGVEHVEPSVQVDTCTEGFSSRLAAHYLVIAGFGERFNDLSGDSFTVDAESRPLVGNGESPFERGVRGCSQADDLDLPGSAVGQQP